MIKFSKIFILTISLLAITPNFALCNNIDNGTFKIGISKTEQVPSVFFGTWRVASKLTSSDSPANFKKENIDIWNLSKDGNVVNLSNPFSGANASITLTYAEQNIIKFTKKNKYEGKILTDTVELNLNGNEFSGINTILLETISDIDNTVIKSVTATYSLQGEKIAGNTIIKENK